MMKRLRELIPVKPEEFSITAMMFFCHFGVMAFYYILDPLRPALFVTNVGSNQLPYAYLLTAVVAGLIAAVMFKASQRWSLITIMTIVSLVIIATLFYFRWAMALGMRDLWYLPWIFYVYMKIVPALTTAQFWILAGYIYDNRQAKRLYRVLILGAGFGALFGSYVPAFLSSRLSTEAMLMICAGIWVVLIVLSQIAWRHRRPGAEVKASATGREEPKERFSDLWKTVFASRHLLLLAMLIFLMFIVSNIADWQINNAAQLHFQSLPTKAARTVKIGELFGRISLAANALSLVFQVLITGFVVRRLGILATIIFLPACLFLSSVGLILFPSYIMAAALVRISDWAPRYSLDKTGRELLYLPLTPAVRKKLKVFIDVFVDRAGRAAAAPVILACISLGLGLQGTAAVAVVLTLICGLMCLSLAKTYVNAFREQLKKREVDFGDSSIYVTDPSSVQLLVGTLGGTNERQILYSLQLLQSVRGVDFSKQLLPLLSHARDYIRQEATRTLHALPGDFAAEAERLLDDSSKDVRLAAIDYLCSRDSAEAQPRMEALLNHANMDVRVDAAQWAADHAGPDFRPQPEFLSQLMSLEGPRGPEARAVAASLATRLPRLEAGQLLHRLIDDKSPEVASAAALAAGKGGYHDLLFPILERLTSAKSREAARSALLAYGDHIAGSLGDVLGDARSDIALRREIPWVLGRIPAQWAADRLTDNLGTEDPQLRLRVVEALDRLHESHSEIQISSTAITARIEAEIRAYYGGLSVSAAIESDKSGASRLLPRVLKERRDHNLEVIFRLLELQHEPKEMHSAYDALKGSRADRRTAAIELLDNVLPLNQKSMILPLLEESSAAPLLEFAKKRFGIQVLQRDDALKVLLASPDPWLTTCALHEIGEKHIRNLADACRALVGDANPWIRETAAWALARC